MAHCNENYLNLYGDYLFTTIKEKRDAYKKAHPDAKIISLGLGEGTQLLVPAVTEAMHKAVEEMAHQETFHGYGPEEGYLFLREAIARHDYQERGCDISPDEIFVSDGAKSDIGSMQEIFSSTEITAVMDPAYPVYVDSNVMAGRSGKFDHGVYQRLEYLSCYEECSFKANLPAHEPMLIYLSSPSDPTGTALNKSNLTMWVRYAKQTGSVIFFDASYEAFITEDNIPHSIYEIEGAKEVAIEFRSYSKAAGFTGIRCGYCVVPEELKLERKNGEMVSANQLWHRRQCTRFNGCSYIAQCGAEAVYSETGRKQIQEVLDIYRNNAKVILEGVKESGLRASGGVNSPYVWVAVPEGMTSWEFFDLLLNKAQIICIPGSGFGLSGEGYVRLSSFNTPELTREAVERMKNVLTGKE